MVPLKPVNLLRYGVGEDGDDVVGNAAGIDDDVADDVAAAAKEDVVFRVGALFEEDK